jgi:hypothetical protein
MPPPMIATRVIAGIAACSHKARLSKPRAAAPSRRRPGG